MKNIQLIHGNSGTELLNVINAINEPVLFFLDGHYSGGITVKHDEETPVNEELDSILSSRNLGHVIIIDDAVFFGTHPAYPSIKEIKLKVSAAIPKANIIVKNEMIIITP